MTQLNYSPYIVISEPIPIIWVNAWAHPNDHVDWVIEGWVIITGMWFTIRESWIAISPLKICQSEHKCLHDSQPNCECAYLMHTIINSWILRCMRMQSHIHWLAFDKRLQYSLEYFVQIWCLYVWYTGIISVVAVPSFLSFVSL